MQHEVAEIMERQLDPKQRKKEEKPEAPKLPPLTC